MANVITPVFRVSYPNVFKPQLNKMSGQEEYSLVALFPKGADLTALKQEAQRALEEKFGKDQKSWPKNIKTPFRDQAERAKNVDGKEVLPAGHEAGAIFMNLKSKQRPGLVDGLNKNEDIISESDFYAGCYAKASVRAYAYDQKGNRGVSFGLQNIQKVKEGEPLTGKMKASDEFSPVEGGGTGGDLFG